MVLSEVRICLLDDGLGEQSSLARLSPQYAWTRRLLQHLCSFLLAPLHPVLCSCPARSSSFRVWCRVDVQRGREGIEGEVEDAAGQAADQGRDAEIDV